jgi:hypothetical protein
MTPTHSHTAPGGFSLNRATCGRLSASSRPLFYSGLSRFRRPHVVGQPCAGAEPSGASTTPSPSVSPRGGEGHNSALGRIGDVERHAATNRNSGFVLDPQTPGAAGATGSTPGATHCLRDRRPSPA